MSASLSISCQFVHVNWRTAKIPSHWIATPCSKINTLSRDSVSPFCKIGIEPSCAKAAEAQDNKKTRANAFRKKGLLIIGVFQKTGSCMCSYREASLLCIGLSGAALLLFSWLTSSFCVFWVSFSSFSLHAAAKNNKRKRNDFCENRFHGGSLLIRKLDSCMCFCREGL